MYAKDIKVSFYNKPGVLKLVKPDPKYAPLTIKWIAKKEVTQYLGADFSKITMDDEVNHLSEMLTNEDCYSWMIKLDDRIVGNVEINGIKELSDKYGVKTGAFCTLIGEPADWGGGLGTCSKQAACNWAFEEGGFDLIEAKAYVQNVRSWGALEKIGYEYHGIEKGEVENEPVEWKVYTLKKAAWAELNWPK